MGYDLHIVRKNDYEDFDEKSSITLEEWLAFVKNDPELELTDGYEFKLPGVENHFQNIPGFCIWRAHPTLNNDEAPWLDYGYGEITSKYPDDFLIRKMISIAEILNGKVQGDDGEFYDENYFTQKTTDISHTSPIVKKSWWKFW